MYRYNKHIIDISIFTCCEDGFGLGWGTNVVCRCSVHFTRQFCIHKNYVHVYVTYFHNILIIVVIIELPRLISTVHIVPCNYHIPPSLNSRWLQRHNISSPFQDLLIIFKICLNKEGHRTISSSREWAYIYNESILLDLNWTGKPCIF